MGCDNRIPSIQSKIRAREEDCNNEKDDRKRIHEDLSQSWEGGRAKTYIAEKESIFGKKLGKNLDFDKKKERDIESDFNGRSNKKPRTMLVNRKLNSEDNGTPRGLPKQLEVIKKGLETKMTSYKRPIGRQ